MNVSQLLSLRLPDEIADRLDRFARRQGNGMTRSRAGLLLIEEALREAEFASIEFRDSIRGRQPYLKGSNLAVWEVASAAEDLGMDAQKVADHFGRPVEWAKAALHYYEAFRQELEPLVRDNREMDFERLKRLLPNLKAVPIPQEEGEPDTLALSRKAGS